MRARTLGIALAGSAIAVMTLAGVSGCSTTGAGDATPSEVSLTGVPVTAQDDMTALCSQIVSQALPVEAAVALAEASGYATQVSVIDGAPQTLTKDIQADRFTLETTDGLVVACTIG